MRCDYFSDGRCASCALMGVPYARQLRKKQQAASAALSRFAGESVWLPAFSSAESGYRNKAKWVIGGTGDRTSIGILDDRGRVTDLRRCGICEPRLREAFGPLADFIAATGLPPYDVPARAGELKNLIVTVSPAGELMVRFVVRDRADVSPIADRLPELQRVLPQLRVASVNIHPEHKAVLEGADEVVLTAQQTLPMTLNGITLQLRPQGFFQTNTAVAAGLYRQAASWADEVRPGSVLDLYCGVGGFALHCATESADSIRGVEISEDAVAGARRSAAGASRPERFSFAAGDAAVADAAADLVIVNPPRRGIAAELAAALETSAAAHVLYSSCNVASLARDLAAMPSLRVRSARLFDMFPQTRHSEVMVLLERRGR